MSKATTTAARAGDKEKKCLHSWGDRILMSGTPRRKELSQYRTKYLCSMSRYANTSS